MPTSDDWITTAEAAQVLAVKPRTVQRMVVSGALVPVMTFPGKTGGHLFSRRAVEAIAAQRQEQAS